MTERIYYADKVIVFASDYQTSEGKTLFVPLGGRLSVAKLLNALEDTYTLTVWSPDTERLLADFFSLFTIVEAAGGAVVAEDGRIMMMRRRGFWDLPKGHLEEGEQIAECALRETVEECGIDPSLVTMGEQIALTRHFYWFQPLERWELKRTAWFRMSYTGDPRDVTPQTEEEITLIEWKSPDDARRAAATSYKTIREVIQNL
jgi:8-oxo-dGTP pyrophosphatase MutT (NUDIX family)